MLPLAGTVLCLLVSCSLLAQQPVFTHQQRFKVEDGLPQNFISGIAQDKDGFLWIGTRDGLARYDGRHFILFRHRYNDSASLSSNVIYSLLLDDENLLWVVYDNHYLDCFDPRRFRVLKRQDRKLTAAKLDEEFVEPDVYFFNHEWYFVRRAPAGGIGVFNFDNDRHSLYNKSNGYLSSDTVLGFTHDGDGRLWLVSPRGLQVATRSREKFQTIFIPNSIRLKFDSRLHVAMTSNLNGELLIADEEKFIIYDSKRQTFRSVSLPAVDPKRGEGNRVIEHLQVIDGACYFIYDAQLFKFEADSIVLLWKSPLADEFHSTGFFIDRSNVFWYATNAGGLLKVDLNGFPITSYAYEHNFYVDILEKNGIPSRALPHQSLMEKWAYNFRYAYEAGGRLLFTALNRQNIFNGIYYWQDKQLFGLPMPAKRFAVFKGIDVDEQDNIWAIDDYNKGLWHWQEKRSIPSFVAIGDNTHRTAGDFVDLLAIDGSFWIASEGGGLYQMRNGIIANHYHQRSKTNPLSSDMLSDLCRDPFDPKKIWIGSLGGGLMLWNTNTGLEKVFTTADGLPNNTIYGIVPDADGNLWLSTNNGVCRFNIKDHTTRQFNTADGLPGSEFNRFHHFKFADGRIAFGGLDGYAIFNPADFKKTDNDLTIELTRVDINNVTQEFHADNKFIKSSLAELDRIDLTYDKNNLTVEFAALNFNEPEKINYRYTLKGADKTWIESGHDNVARYTRLSPGSYKLLINASNSLGQWGKEIKEISIHVQPPIWATWWAYTIYIMLLAAAMVWYWGYRERMIRMKEQMAFEHREAARLKEIDEFKDRFFNNITHEFRTLYL